MSPHEHQCSPSADIHSECHRPVADIAPDGTLASIKLCQISVGDAMPTLSIESRNHVRGRLCYCAGGRAGSHCCSAASQATRGVTAERQDPGSRSAVCQPAAHALPALGAHAGIQVRPWSPSTSYDYVWSISTLMLRGFSKDFNAMKASIAQPIHAFIRDSDAQREGRSKLSLVVFIG